MPRKPSFFFLCLCTLILVVLAIHAPGSCGPAAEDQHTNPWTHSWYFENDLFAGTDRNYTNGVKYTVISPDLAPSARKSGRLPKAVLDVIHKIPLIADSAPGVSHKVEFSLGQNIYTPNDIKTTELITDDRPYAGWTYLSTAYHQIGDLDQPVSTMDTLEIQAGMVGPCSLAEEAQNLIHEIRGLQLANGWDHQLADEPGFVLAFERKWLFRPVYEGFGYDIISHTGITLGNISTYLNGGLQVRVGWNIPHSFGTSLIRPAGTTRTEKADRNGVYFLAAFNTRLVFRDIFLDGNTFADSHSIEKETLVADLAAGVAVNYGRFMATFTQVYRTDQFKGQSEPHSFGALSISCFF